MTAETRQLRAAVRNACLRLLKLSAEVHAESAGSVDLPRRRITSRWLTPGKERGNRVAERDVLDHFARWAGTDELENSNEWQKAEAVLDQYIDLVGGSHSVMLPEGAATYLADLVTNYFEDAGSYVYDSSKARRAVRELLAFLEQAHTNVVVLVALNNFCCPDGLEPEPGVTLRQVTEHDLWRLGEAPIPELEVWTPSSWIPTTQWWICEGRSPNPRGTTKAWNRYDELEDVLTSTLRLYRPGRFTIGTALVYQAERFGLRPIVRGGRLTPYRSTAGDYELAARDQQKVTSLWRRTKTVLEAKSHYLQLAIGRLVLGGKPRQPEDAIVDYVIGLESLLSTTTEFTELRYRLSVRASVVLAQKFIDRHRWFKKMRAIYDCRSAIVHGRTPDAEELRLSTDDAEEALRGCLRWYLENWLDSGSNDQAVEEIDRRLGLVSPSST